MKTLFILSGLLGLLFAAPIHAEMKASAASSREASLLVAECLPAAGIADPQVLTSYTFADGKFARREKILTIANHQLRFEFGENPIVSNRYVITQQGGIVDFQKQTVLHESNGEQFIAVEDQSVIFYRSNDQSFYRYDLAAGQYSRLDSPGKWALLRKSLGLSQVNVLAPDGTKAVVEGALALSPTTNRLTAVDGQLTLCTLKGEAKPLGKEFFNELSLISSCIAPTPLLWLDNEHVLTQNSNGRLVSLSTNGSIEPVVNIDIPALPTAPCRLSRDLAGRIIYECGSAYVIDVQKKQFASLLRVQRGHGFEMEPDKWPAVDLGIYYQGKEIARGRFDGGTAKTMAGYLAVAAPEDPQAGSVEHVKIWNAQTKTWFSLPLGGRLIKVIGWTQTPYNSKASQAL